jgi:RNA polymerase sigma-70 factor, ECF subfamily
MDRQQQFLQLFLKHQHDLRAFVASVVRDWHRSEDILQEVSLVLWRRFDEFDACRSFGGWARGIAGNMILKDLDRHRRGLPLLTPEAIQSVLTVSDQAQAEPTAEQDMLRRCLQRLSAHAKRLIALRYERSLPLDQLAAEVAASIAAVKKALSRIRAQLHRCMCNGLGIDADKDRP